MYRLFALLTLASLCSAPAFASSALLTSDPGTGTTTVFSVTAFNLDVTSATLNGVPITGNPNFTEGPGYSFGINGNWTDIEGVGTNGMDGNGSITFDLGGAYSFVGIFMNYAPGVGTGSIITALGLDGTTVIGTYDLTTLAPISTPGETDAGAFRGIESDSADIGYLELSGSFSAAHSIEVGDVSSVTPEPSSFLLLATGLAGAAGVLRRRLSVS